MADLTPEAIAELRRLPMHAPRPMFYYDPQERLWDALPALLDAAEWAVKLQADIKAGMDAIDRGEFTTVDKMRDELNAEVLDAAERCAAAEAQAKAAGELLRALKHVLANEGEWKPSSVSVAVDAIEAAERAGVKP